MTVPVSNMTATFANTTIRYDAIGMDVNASSYAANSNLINLKTNGNTKFSVDVSGNTTVNGTIYISGSIIANGDIISLSDTGDITAKTLIANVINSNTVTSNVFTSNTINTNFLLINGKDADPIGQQTIWVPALAMIPRTTNGASTGSVETTTNRVMIRTLDFDTTTQEFAQFAIQMPKSWNESTLISQFIWSHSNTATNFGVAWQIQAVALADVDVLDSAFGSNVTVTDTGGVNNAIYITSETPAMTVAGSPGAEEYVVFQVARVPANASDTLAIDARLHGVKIHYTVDVAKDD